MPYLLLALLGLTGFLLALYIAQKKHKPEPMVCPLGADCDAVIHSNFSKFLGIPVELIGIIYYGLIAACYGALFFNATLATPMVIFVLGVLASTAALFSLYLIGAQAFALKNWCSWCLLSAAITFVITGIVFSGHISDFINMLAEFKAWILGAHLLGLAIGLGGATIADIFFFKSLKDFRIEKHEAETLRTLSHVVALGFGLLILSGIGLYLPQFTTLLSSSKFLVKMAVVAVLGLNGLIMHMRITPRFALLSYGEEQNHASLRRFRRLAFVCGAISLPSWYIAFGLGAARSIPLSTAVGLSLYALILIIAVSIALHVETSYAKRAKRQ